MTHTALQASAHWALICTHATDCYCRYCDEWRDRCAEDADYKRKAFGLSAPEGRESGTPPADANGLRQRDGDK
jgi:hypothetical protein